MKNYHSDQSQHGENDGIHRRGESNLSIAQAEPKIPCPKKIRRRKLWTVKTEIHQTSSSISRFSPIFDVSYATFYNHEKNAYFLLFDFAKILPKIGLMSHGENYCQFGAEISTLDLADVNECWRRKISPKNKAENSIQLSFHPIAFRALANNENQAWRRPIQNETARQQRLQQLQRTCEMNAISLFSYYMTC